MKKLARRIPALGAMVTAILAFSIQAAHAQSGSWNLSTTGAASWGTYSTSGLTYNFAANVKDTAADSSCAYVTFRPQVRYNIKGVSTWLTAGTTGYELRKEVCGSGVTLVTWPSINVWDKMSWNDKTFGEAVRMRITVCRNVNNASDNCSGMVTTPITIG